MKTRLEYLNRKCTHSEYYSQFVTDYIKQIVQSTFGKENLVKFSKEDEHLNNIPLTQWDGLAFHCFHKNHTLKQQLKEVGDGYTMAGGIYILKEAAKQVIKES